MIILSRRNSHTPPGRGTPLHKYLGADSAWFPPVHQNHECCLSSIQERFVLWVGHWHAIHALSMQALVRAAKIHPP